MIMENLEAKRLGWCLKCDRIQAKFDWQENVIWYSIRWSGYILYYLYIYLVRYADAKNDPSITSITLYIYICNISICLQNIRNFIGDIFPKCVKHLTCIKNAQSPGVPHLKKFCKKIIGKTSPYLHFLINYVYDLLVLFWYIFLMTTAENCPP